MTPTLSLAAVAVTALALAAGPAAAAGAAGTADHGHGRPVLSAAPASAPAATRHDHTCQVADSGAPPARAGHHGLVWVRRDPISVTAEWIPGLNQPARACHTRLTTAGQGRATGLAARIERSKAVYGVYSCPFDDGTAVQLWFHYASGQDEYVDVPLGGCRFLSAPQRRSRWETAGLTRTLHAMAPERWKPATRTQ